MSLPHPLAAAAGALAATALPSAALADRQGIWSVEAVYTADVMGPVSGAGKRAGRYLDNLDLTAEADLEKALGWTGARLFVYGLNNSGGQPNGLVGTLQGVDNIEVGRPRGRLYELWLEQAFLAGRASARVGLYDLNSEFYATEASDLLLGPSFGIGPELAAMGPNGPSIFPSTSLSARLRIEPRENLYLQAAVLNAEARTLGDPRGIDTGFGRGALAIVEGGTQGDTRLALGAWRYTERQDDVRGPGRSTPGGAYVLAEHSFVAADGAPQVRTFFRGGISEGDTTPFRGSWQAGFKVEGLVPGAPDGVLSFGAHQAFLSRAYRANAADEGLDLGRAETGLELTYAHPVGDRLTLQPNLQYIVRPGGDRAAADVTILGLRVTLDLL